MIGGLLIRGILIGLLFGVPVGAVGSAALWCGDGKEKEEIYLTKNFITA